MNLFNLKADANEGGFYKLRIKYDNKSKLAYIQAIQATYQAICCFWDGDFILFLNIPILYILNIYHILYPLIYP